MISSRIRASRVGLRFILQSRRPWSSRATGHLGDRGGTHSPLAPGPARLLQRGPSLTRLRRDAQLARENRRCRGRATRRACGTAQQGEDPRRLHLWFRGRGAAYIGQRHRLDGDRPRRARGPATGTRADSRAPGPRGQSDDLSPRRVGGASLLRPARARWPENHARRHRR